MTREDIQQNISCGGKDYYVREGYYFRAIKWPLTIKDAIIITDKPEEATRCWSWYREPIRSKEEHIALIKELELEAVYVLDDNIDFIRECPSIKYIIVIPTLEEDGFDYSPLYSVPEIYKASCNIEYGEDDQYKTQIDLSRINGLQVIEIDDGIDRKNCAGVKTAKTVYLYKHNKENVVNAYASTIVDTLCIDRGKLTSLEGIESSPKLQYMSIYGCRKLRDISVLGKVKDSLKALIIECCPNIEDYSVLRELKNLELLRLIGQRNTIQDISFVNDLPRLSFFVCDYNILDGDLTPCMRLDYATIINDRKHYNLKHKELPRGEKRKPLRGNEDIDIWRRYE